MEREDFEELTGITLTDEQRDQYETVEAKARRRLQKLLGWELRSSDNYEEVGQYLNPSFLIDQRVIQEMVDDNTLEEYLQEPDELINTWRLYPYYDVNTNLRIDPATAIHNVKLVYPLIEEENQFITICNLTKYIPLVGKSVDRTNYITYIKKLQDVPESCPCRWMQTGTPMLAVDAEWLARKYPTELAEILADAIIYEYQHPVKFTADAGRKLKSYTESVDGHSISKGYADDEGLNSTDPLKNEDNLTTIKDYIGPWSPLYKERRIY